MVLEYPTTATIGAVSSAVAPTYRAVYEQNAGFVWRSLRRLGVREADLLDVCQEVFVIVHRRWGDLQPDAPIRAWLFAIARRAAADYRQLAHVRKESLTGEFPEAGVAATQLEAIERDRARHSLTRILDELDEEKRAVFTLYEFEEMQMAEVAAAVECPVQTAYSRLHAARKLVEAAIERAVARGVRP